MEPLLATITVLAHQGGWDEFLMVAAPIVVFAFLLRLANRRASHLGDDEGAAFRSDHNPESDQPHRLI